MLFSVTTFAAFAGSLGFGLLLDHTGPKVATSVSLGCATVGSAMLLSSTPDELPAYWPGFLLLALTAGGSLICVIHVRYCREHHLTLRMKRHLTSHTPCTHTHTYTHAAPSIAARLTASLQHSAAPLTQVPSSSTSLLTWTG